MGTVAAIGEQVRVAGLALAGVEVLPAEDAGTVRRVWAALPDRVDLVLLTPAAAAALGPAAAARERPLTAVLPEGGDADAPGGGESAAAARGPVAKPAAQTEGRPG